MEGASVVGDFYVDAKRAISSGTFSQEVEDEIDLLLGDEMDEESFEIEALLDDGFRWEKPRVEVSPAEMTEFAIKIPNPEGELARFSFEGRRYLRPIYDSQARRILLKCARQTEKSTFFGNRLISYSAIIPAFNSLYVSSTGQQAQVFSVDRIKEPLEISPELNFLFDTKLNQNVFFKQFRNRSRIRIRYAYLSADRVRGIPSDQIVIDEIQDIFTHNIPVIEQCASHSNWKIFLYGGTPKTKDNTIEVYWSNYSTQNEWVVPCERHGTPNAPHTWHWNVLGPRNIGKKGPICAKCKKPIDPMHPMAQWQPMNPITEKNQEVVTFEGYHISQLMVPWVNWKEDILLARERYDKARFYNEALGLSFDSGLRPLTRSQVQACCRDEIKMRELEANASRCVDGVFMGLDWGTGERASYTLLSLGGYMGGEFQIFFAHRFTGEDLDPQKQLVKIVEIVSSVNLRLIGADYGGGHHPNDWLMRNYGPTKLFRFQYAANPKMKIKWQPKLGRYIVHRTEAMSDLFNAIKRRKIWFPRWAEWDDPHGTDMLNIFSEWNRQLNMIQYGLSPGKSDDTFHSMLYCFLVSMLVRPRPDIILPVKSESVDLGPNRLW